MERLKWPDDEAIEAKMVSRAVENAQKQIEELNYERRKNVLKYDEVMNGQREAIYGERRKILEGQDIDEQVEGLRRGRGGRDRAALVPARRLPRGVGPGRAVHGAARDLPRAGHRRSRPPRPPTAHELERAVHRGRAGDVRRQGASTSTPTVMRELERVVLLNITDTKWREHLYEMDYLQEGIHLRALAQKDPITEYRREAYDMFQELTDSIQADFVRYIYRVEFVQQEQPAAGAAAQAGAGQPRRGRAGRRPAPLRTGTANAEPGRQRQDAAQRPCPCGSGKKYKKCHGAAV